MKLRIRVAREGDISFIFATWLHGYKYGNFFNRTIQSKIYYKEHQRIIERLLLRPNTRVFICCDAEDEWHILGYLVKEQPSTLHWIFVKEQLRDFTVARFLLKSAGIPEDLSGYEFSHFSKAASILFKARRLKGYFNPYLLMESYGQAPRNETHVSEFVRQVG